MGDPKDEAENDGLFQNFTDFSLCFQTRLTIPTLKSFIPTLKSFVTLEYFCYSLPLQQTEGTMKLSFTVDPLDSVQWKLLASQKFTWLRVLSFVSRCPVLTEEFHLLPDFLCVTPSDCKTITNVPVFTMTGNNFIRNSFPPCLKGEPYLFNLGHPCEFSCTSSFRKCWTCHFFL